MSDALDIFAQLIAETTKAPTRGRAAGGKASRTVFSRAKQLLSRHAEGKKGGGKGEKKYLSAKKTEPSKTKQMAGGGGRQAARSHYPFKNKSTLGPTKIYRVRPPAPPPRGTRVHRRKHQWSCKKIESYKQMCTGIGQTNKGKKLKINIDRGYKKSYNKAFKRNRTLKRAEARRQGKQPTV